MKAQTLSLITLIMRTKLNTNINIEKTEHALSHEYSSVLGQDIGNECVEL